MCRHIYSIHATNLRTCLCINKQNFSFIKKMKLVAFSSVLVPLKSIFQCRIESNRRDYILETKMKLPKTVLMLRLAMELGQQVIEIFGFLELGITLQGLSLHGPCNSAPKRMLGNDPVCESSQGIYPISQTQTFQSPASYFWFNICFFLQSHIISNLLFLFSIIILFLFQISRFNIWFHLSTRFQFLSSPHQ